MPGKQSLFMHSLLQSFRGRSADQAAIQQVMDCTDELVGHALQADWSNVLDGMERRRRLLQPLIDNDAGRFNPEISALATSVEESERAMMRMIAHAIASSRFNGAAFEMYH